METAQELQKRNNKAQHLRVIQVEEENSELEPGFYLSSLTPKEVWEKL